jgi:putative glutamine amidotransferase
VSRPRIAIPEPTSTDIAYNQRSLPQYVRAVEEAGGIAVPLSLQTLNGGRDASDWASCAAILLPGSPADLDPLRYGQQPQKECAARDEAREAADNLLLRDAFDQGKPVLGICYGLQSLNVWRQGTLVQDLPHPTPVDEAIVNHEPGREVQSAHPVVVASGSRLSRITACSGEKRIPVNSSHHQAIDRPGDQLRVAATSPADGVIEALEGADPEQFIVGVQWHPERSYESSAASRALFAAFVEAARAWTRSRLAETP